MIGIHALSELLVEPRAALAEQLPLTFGHGYPQSQKFYLAYRPQTIKHLLRNLYLWKPQLKIDSSIATDKMVFDMLDDLRPRGYKTSGLKRQVMEDERWCE